MFNIGQTKQLSSNEHSIPCRSHVHTRLSKTAFFRNVRVTMPTAGPLAGHYFIARPSRIDARFSKPHALRSMRATGQMCLDIYRLVGGYPILHRCLFVVFVLHRNRHLGIFFCSSFNSSLLLRQLYFSPLPQPSLYLPYSQSSSPDPTKPTSNHAHPKPQQRCPPIHTHRPLQS